MALYLCNGGSGSVDDIQIADFDFTKSLTDSINGFTATLSGGVSRTDDGLFFGSSNTGKALLNNLDGLLSLYGGFSFELGFGETNITPTSHVRFFTISSNSECGFIYRYGGANNKFSMYFKDGWASNSEITDPNYFSNKTLKLNYEWGNLIKYYEGKNNIYSLTHALTAQYASGITPQFSIGGASQSLINSYVKSLKVFFHK